MIITIDGAAGTGKTTISHALGRAFKLDVIHSGDIYRGIAWQISGNISDWTTNSVEAWIEAANQVDFNLDPSFEIRNDRHKIFSKNDLNTLAISSIASSISVIPEIRDIVNNKIRDAVNVLGGCIVEGRDMGTITFPDADLKFFLRGSLKTRAARRYKEIIFHNPGLKISYEDVEKQMKERDNRDSNKEFGALKPAKDSIIIDIEKEFQSVVDEISNYIKGENGARRSPVHTP